MRRRPRRASSSFGSDRSRAFARRFFCSSSSVSRSRCLISPLRSMTAPAEPRKGTELRKPPAPAAPARPAGDASASRPAAPSVRPATASVPTVSAGGGEDEDPEKLLREYADRQKTKMVRLEQQVVEYK